MITAEEKKNFREDVDYRGLDEAVESWTDETASELHDDGNGMAYELAYAKAQEYVSDLLDACGFNCDYFDEPLIEERHPLANWAPRGW